jgi:hypothetical protein
LKYNKIKKIKRIILSISIIAVCITAYSQLDITKRNVTVTQNLHVRSDTVLNSHEVRNLIHDSIIANPSAINIDTTKTVASGHYATQYDVRNVIKKATYTLSAPDIIAGTAREIIPAPGSGRYIHIISGIGIYTATTPTSVNGSIMVSHGTNDIAISINTTIPSSIFYLDFDIQSGGGVVENTAIYVSNKSAVTDGNGSCKINIVYTIEDY